MYSNITPLRYKILFLASWFPNRTNEVLGVFIKRKALAVSTKCNVAVLYVTADVFLRNKNYEVECHYEDGLLVVRVYFKYLFSGITKKIETVLGLN